MKKDKKIFSKGKPKIKETTQEITCNVCMRLAMLLKNMVVKMKTRIEKQFECYHIVATSNYNLLFTLCLQF